MEQEIRKIPVRYHEIDVFRFFAAFVVVLFHYTFRGYAADHLSPIPYPALGAIFKYGYLGVELFFIISGYVVLMSAYTKTVRQFFVSRVVRLYPAFWLACTASFLITYFFGPPEGSSHWSPYMDVSPGQYVYNMTMMHMFFGARDVDGVYWTLTIEIIFYFLVSLLIAYKWMRHLILFLAIWLGYTAWVGYAIYVTPFATLLFPAYSPFFIAGMAFYLLQQQIEKPWKLYSMLGVSWVLAIRNGFSHAREYQTYYGVPFSPVVVGVIITLFFGLFFLVVFRSFRLQRFTWLYWAGALTYPLYLIHHNIGYILFQRLHGKVDDYVLLTTVILLMLILAYGLHVYVERPLSKWLKMRLAYLFAWLDRSKTKNPERLV